MCILIFGNYALRKAPCAFDTEQDFFEKSEEIMSFVPPSPACIFCENII